jgi:hypothetical protein
VKEGSAMDTSVGDGGLGHGDALAGFDGVYEDGLYRRRRGWRRGTKRPSPWLHGEWDWEE